MRNALLSFARGLVPKPAYLYLRASLKLGYLPNVIAPQTFNEKILAKMLFDRSPVLVTAADKLLARKFVAERFGAQFLPALRGVWADAQSLRLDPAWGAVVVKANHASGFVELVPDAAKADVAQLRRTVAPWFRFNYGRSFGEWCYRDIEPMVFAEEMLGNGDPDALVDYKVFCFQGQPRFLKVIRGMQGATRSFYADLAYRDLQIRDGQPPLEARFQTPPPNFGAMLELAQRIASEFEMIRVDMYNVDGRIYVGELTNYPQAGIARFHPADADGRLGAYWDRAGMSYLPLTRRARAAGAAPASTSR
jgi:hypothetical protein